MFQKIFGVAGTVAVLGTIIMVALSPRKEGFFPELSESGTPCRNPYPNLPPPSSQFPSDSLRGVLADTPEPF